MYSLVYSPEMQASLDRFLVKIHMDLQKVIKVLDRDIQQAMDFRAGILQPAGDVDETIETILDPGFPLRVSTLVVEEEGGADIIGGDSPSGTDQGR